MQTLRVVEKRGLAPIRRHPLRLDGRRHVAPGARGSAAALGDVRHRRRGLRDSDGAAGGPHRHPSGSAASRAAEDLAGQGGRRRARRAALAGHPDHRHRLGDDRGRRRSLSAAVLPRIGVGWRVAIGRGGRDRRAGAGVRSAHGPQRGRPHVSRLGAARESARPRARRDGPAAHHARRRPGCC